MPSDPPPPNRPTKSGELATAASFVIWGLSPLYWTLLPDISSFQVVAWRILFALGFLSIALTAKRHWKNLLDGLRNGRVLAIHLVSASLIAVNWVAYIYAVTHHHLLQGSLAYFMVPILNVLMGTLLLHEKLTRLQWTAVALATAGVLNELIQFGKLPFLALIMAFSFSLYGLLKKRSPMGPLSGLSIECSLLLPGVMAYLLWQSASGELFLPATLPSWLLLSVSGAITAAPLLLFAFGAQRIPLAMVGIFQFLAPTLKFALGTLYFNEAFDRGKLITFALIWIAVVAFIISQFQRSRAKLMAPPPPNA